MKKLLALTLTMAMLFTMTAMAEDKIITNQGTASTDVKAAYVAGDASGTVYSVDITWGALEFTYKDKAQGKWDPSTHSYIGAEENGEWIANGNSITITNHSNTAITASLSYISIVEGIVGSFNVDTLELASAVNTTYEEAPSKISSLALSGTLLSTYTDLTKVGTITVSINNDSLPNITPVISRLIPGKYEEINVLKTNGLRIDIEGENLDYITTNTIGEYILINANENGDNVDITNKGEYTALNSTNATITFDKSHFMYLDSFDSLNCIIK